MNTDQMWNNESPTTELGIDVPQWIDSHISPYNVIAIVQGGCASGAYMPAATYDLALKIMQKYSDFIFDYLEEIYGNVPLPSGVDPSWGGLACFYVSLAVETWAAAVYQELEEMEDVA